jgi:NitT/TauT family transport system ATP-binding protein
MNNDLIEINQVSFGYDKSEVISNLDLSIERNSIVSIMGPSGCGKSTLLRLISGLGQPSAGTIFFNGSSVLRPPKDLRYSFQDYDAFPWLTVKQNILLFSRFSRAKAAQNEADDLLKQIGLYEHAKKYPAQLSGGMRKRLALGRCIAGEPEAVLLDEPFSSLDVAARDELHKLVLDLAHQIKCTFVIVTHNINEAVFLSSRVIVATPIPFRIKKIVKVPFTYPRDPQVRVSHTFDVTCEEIRSQLVRS